MPTYHLTPKPAVAEAMRQGLPVSERLHAVAMTAGYVIGEGGIQVYGDGSVVIDCDRDPSADWTQFDPVTMLTPEEIASQQEADERADLAAIVTTYLDTLDTNEMQLVAGIAALKGQHPTLPQPTTVAALRTYVTAMAEMTLDHNRGLARLIRYLVRNGGIAS